MANETDVDMEELLRLTRENNKMLRKMRRAAVLSFWWRIIFFLIVSGSLYYAYQYYVHDYVVEMQKMYDELQEGVGTVKALPATIGL